MNISSRTRHAQVDKKHLPTLKSLEKYGENNLFWDESCNVTIIISLDLMFLMLSFCGLSLFQSKNIQIISVKINIISGVIYQRVNLHDLSPTRKISTINTRSVGHFGSSAGGDLVDYKISGKEQIV